MRFFLVIFISLHLIADEEDIIERKILNFNDHNQNTNSFCKTKPSLGRTSWFEDFKKSKLLASQWNYSISNGFYDGRKYISGWGNGELQYYTKPKKNSNTNTTENIFIEDGYLKIQPIKKYFKGFQYTSARINTKGLKDFTYPSEITICFKVPRGIGFWPAIWLMPVDDIKWPNGGEIDILENRGRITNISSSALHFGKKYNEKSTLVGEVLIPKYLNFQDKFHSITLKWEMDKLSFYLDNHSTPYFQVDKSHPEFKKYSYPFNRNYYLIINVAVGGKYDDYLIDSEAFCKDSPCSNTTNPDDRRFIIDWIDYRKL